MLCRIEERHGCGGVAAVGWGKPPAAPFPGPLQPPSPSQPTRFPSSSGWSRCVLLLLGDCLPGHTIPPACDTAREAAHLPHLNTNQGNPYAGCSVSNRNHGPRWVCCSGSSATPHLPQNLLAGQHISRATKTGDQPSGWKNGLV